MPPIMEMFSELRNPRGRKCRYPLDEILFTMLCAVLCCIDDWETIKMWGRYQLEWLYKYLSWGNHIPSKDTFRRMFSALSATGFEQCFIEWMRQLCPSLAGQHVAIDGKTVRRSRTKEEAALHLVSAWCSENGLNLGQVKTADKSNEITAIPQLLAALDLTGATVTIDAMGTQHEIAKTIETRVCRVTDEVAWLTDMRLDWAGIKRLAMVERTRQIGEKITTEHRSYISSKPVKAVEMGHLIWGIENKLHWVLDMSWDEDASQIREKTAARNMATIRKITLNLAHITQKNHLKKISLRNVRNLAAWDTVERATVLIRFLAKWRYDAM
jgi:predicted transposase YbfD/YdcC